MIRFDIEADDNIQVPVTQPQIHKKEEKLVSKPIEEQTRNQIENQQRVLGSKYVNEQLRPKSNFFDKLSMLYQVKGLTLMKMLINIIE